jgi:hypothetical protein
MADKVTITRSATEGSNSGRFYPPIEVMDYNRRIEIVDQSDPATSVLQLWPDEAEKLGLALIKIAARV